MSFFIFSKNFDNMVGSLYKIAENQNDLNSLNINQSDYKIIEDTQENFNAVKYGTKVVDKYNGDQIFYSDSSIKFSNKIELQTYINSFCNQIQNFLDNNNNNYSYYNQWKDYKNQLKNLNLNNFTYPLNKSLEQHFNDLGQTSYNILQLP